jgi:hypothetical protein
VPQPGQVRRVGRRVAEPVEQFVDQVLHVGGDGLDGLEVADQPGRAVGDDVFEEHRPEFADGVGRAEQLLADGRQPVGRVDCHG